MAAWYAARLDEINQTPRRFLGRPWGEDAFRIGLQRGYQRQRRAAAFAIAVASPDGKLVNWRTRWK